MWRAAETDPTRGFQRDLLGPRSRPRELGGHEEQRRTIRRNFTTLTQHILKSGRIGRGQTLLDAQQGMSEFRWCRPTRISRPRADRENVLVNGRRVATILVFINYYLAILRCVGGAADIATKGRGRTRGPGAQRRRITIINAKIARRARGISATNALDAREPLSNGRGLIGWTEPTHV